jgi:hypothetical protein
MDEAGGLVDSGGEQSDAGPGWWRSVRPGGTVEADDRMKVDNAAPLVFGDLGEGDPHLAASALLVSPAWRARVQRRAMVNRRHSSGAQALKSTALV